VIFAIRIRGTIASATACIQSRTLESAAAAVRILQSLRHKHKFLLQAELVNWTIPILRHITRARPASSR
jgi:hypothetical protein